MMIPQPLSRRVLPALVAALLFGAVATHAQNTAQGVAQNGAQNGARKPERPKLSLRSNPVFAFSPAVITLTAELKDGDNDFAEFYCASIEWDWDDGTRSTASDDCEPYEAGKSEIRRRFAIQHAYNIPGVYNVRFRLKQRGEVVAQVSRRVTIRRGR